LCVNYASNGSEPHEVRWLPTTADQDFGTFAETSNPDCGSITMLLRGVDSTISAGGTQATPNGFFTQTTVYEWIPDANEAARIPLVAPTATTMQYVMSKITDIGDFVAHGLSSNRNFGYRLLTAGATLAMNRSHGRGQNLIMN
jgi:LPS sulfotransferase NodH